MIYIIVIIENDIPKTVNESPPKTPFFQIAEK